MLQFQLPPIDVAPGDPQRNKFEQVYSGHHQMSTAGGVLRSDVWGMRGQGTPTGLSLQCDLSHDAYEVTYPPTPIICCGQTHTSENVAFPQLRWRVVITHNFVVQSSTW